MDKLQDMMSPIQESSIDLVRCENETADNVEIDFCEEGGLVIKYQKDIMIINRDVLQNIILMVENKDIADREANFTRLEKEGIQKMIDFIATAELQEIKDWYDTDTVCDMLNDWDMLSGTHQYGVSSYITTLFNNVLIDLNEYEIRKAVYKRIG